MNMANKNEDVLPEGWIFTTLGSFTNIVGGSTPSRNEARYFGGNIIWLTPTEIPKETVSIISDSKEKLTEAGFNASGVRWIPAGSVLLTSRASIGYVAIAGTSLTTNQGFASFILPEGIEPNYLGWWLRCQKNLLKELAGGTTFKEISKTTLKDVSFPLAPTNEQRRIVAAIEQQFTRLDAGIVALQQAREKLKRYRAALLKAAVEGKLTEAWRADHPDREPATILLERILKEQWARWESDQLAKMQARGITPKDDAWKKKYVEPAAPDTDKLPELPKGWCWATVGQISQIQGGIQKQPSRAPRNNAFPYLRVANVFRGRLDLTNIEKMELFGDELEVLRLEVGDLLIVEGNGSRTEIGRSALWKGEIQDCVHQNHIIRVRLCSVIPEYLDFYWNSPYGTERVTNVAASTTGLYTLSVSKIARLPVPLPSLAEQQEIVAEVERRLTIISELETTIESNLKRAERLRQVILREAFAGRLVPQDPNDEPATILLERIHDERKRREQEEQQQRKEARMTQRQERQAKDATKPQKLPLYDLLVEASQPIKPDDLLSRSGLHADSIDDVETFYDELGKEFRAGRIIVVDGLLCGNQIIHEL